MRSGFAQEKHFMYSIRQNIWDAPWIQVVRKLYKSTLEIIWYITNTYNLRRNIINVPLLNNCTKPVCDNGARKYSLSIEEKANKIILLYSDMIMTNIFMINVFWLLFSAEICNFENILFFHKWNYYFIILIYFSNII